VSTSEQAAEPLLAVDDLVVRYGNLTAVQGVSLEVRAGEVVGLIGPNGAGKTSTLLAIFGLVASSGSIHFDGRPLAGLAPEKVVRSGIALVPEGRQVFGTLTVEENLRLGATPRSDRHAIEDDLKRIFELFPVLERYLTTHAGRLSGGEQQQLAIGRALLSKPRLLLLDEPSLGLAPIVIDGVFDALDELRRSGVTILLVEQNAARTVEFADRTYLLRSGRIAASGTRETLPGMVDLAHAYLGV
jgi:branched-chain amino acid transport system ATP-binding protein